MLWRMLHFTEMHEHLDATDTIAYTHFLALQQKTKLGDFGGGHAVKIPKSSGVKTSWDDFL